MEESEFNDLADAELLRIEAAVENCGADVDVESKPGGVLEIEFENDTKVIVNRHAIAQEIWVAAKSGGFHFKPREGGWVSARDNAELYETLSRVISEQSGRSVTVIPE